MAKKIKPKYPESIPFHFMGFDWIIKFLDIETDNHGVTDVDAKIVHIYYKTQSDQNVLETLLHELMHVLMLDMADAVFKHDAEKPFDLEENMIRLTSPRLFSIIRDNPKLVDFIIKKIKEL